MTMPETVRANWQAGRREPEGRRGAQAYALADYGLTPAQSRGAAVHAVRDGVEGIGIILPWRRERYSVARQSSPGRKKRRRCRVRLLNAACGRNRAGRACRAVPKGRARERIVGCSGDCMELRLARQQLANDAGVEIRHRLILVPCHNCTAAVTWRQPRARKREVGRGPHRRLDPRVVRPIRLRRKQSERRRK